MAIYCKNHFFLYKQSMMWTFLIMSIKSTSLQWPVGPYFVILDRVTRHLTRKAKTKKVGFFVDISAIFQLRRFTFDMNLTCYEAILFWIYPWDDLKNNICSIYLTFEGYIFINPWWKQQPIGIKISVFLHSVKVFKISYIQIRDIFFIKKDNSRFCFK